MDVGVYAAHGLYDPSAPTAGDRLALLEWLTDQGITLEQMVDANDRGMLTHVAGALTLRPGERLTLAEVADRSGLSLEEVRALSLVVGLPVTDPDEGAYAAGDVEVFKLFEPGAQFFGEEALKRFLRVVASSMARVADAACSVFVTDVQTPLETVQAGELALAKSDLEATGWLNLLPGLMDAVFRPHMERAIEQIFVVQAGATAKPTVPLAVGFVDLVGFTPLAQRLAATELSAMVDGFEAAASDTVTLKGGRVVKLIGDEVMFVALDPMAACEIALALVERFGDDELEVTPRGGVAVGEVLMRGGDYYGPIVNVASRVAELAVPNEILVTNEVHGLAGDGTLGHGLEFLPAGRRLLKGFPDPIELFAVTRQHGETAAQPHASA
jgi:class 3 adenylate cyclase